MLPFIILKYILFALGVLFLHQGVVNVLMRQYKPGPEEDLQLKNYSRLAFISSSLCFLIFAACNTPKGRAELLLLHLIWINSQLVHYYYFKSLTVYSAYSPRVISLIQKFQLALVYLTIFGLGQFLLGDPLKLIELSSDSVRNPFLRGMLNNQRIMPNLYGSVVMFGGLLSSLLVLAGFVWSFIIKKLKDKVILFGVLLSLALMANELALVLFDWEHAIIGFFFSNSFEIFRVTYLAQINKGQKVLQLTQTLNDSLAKKNETLKQDVIERKQAEKKLKEAFTKVAEANKLKEDFVANINHEMRTPLNYITSSIEILKRRAHCNLTSYQTDMLNKIEKGSSMLRAIVEDILDLSRFSSPKFKLDVKAFDLSAMASDCIDYAETKNINNLQLTLDIAENLPHLVVGDEVRVKQVITNLLINAVKFTKRGSVCLSIYNNSDSPNVLTFEVKDSGPGITKENQDSIFDRFYQIDSSTSRAVEGSGLGLAICKELVNLMKGRIELESAPAIGTKFSVYLPLPALTHKAITDNKINKLSLEKRTKTAPSIMLVDDNQTLLDLLEEQVNILGYPCVSVSSGTEAIKALEKSTFDFILLDIMMPEMDGYDLAQKIRALSGYNKTPIIALTGKFHGTETAAKNHPYISQFLLKPISIDELNSVITEHTH